MTGIGLAATGVIKSDHLKKGDPEVLFNGMDYLGNICGVTNFTDAMNENIINKPKAYILPSGLNVCIESCPVEMNMTKFHCKYDVDAFIMGQAKTAKQSLYLYYTSQEDCMPHVETTSYLGYCAPNIVGEYISEQMKNEYENHNITTNSNLTIAEKSGMSGGEFFDESVADTYLARYVILTFGVGGAMILGFLFLGLLRLPGTFPLKKM